MKKTLKTAMMIVAAAFMMTTAAYGASTQSELEKWNNYEQLWEALRKNWDENVNTYQCEIIGTGYRTEHFANEFKEFWVNGEKPEVDWTYRIYQIRFRKPNWILFKYNYSAHEQTEKGNLIDRAVAYVLKFTGGTTFNFGYKGTDICYIKFPYISNKEFSKYPIPIHWKAMMKVLMIASRNEIYKRPLSELRDPRGNSVDALIIGETMKKFDAMCATPDRDMIIRLEPSPRFGKEDYILSEDGWVTLKPAALDRPNTVIKIYLEDKNIKRSRGINKYEAFVDPETMMFAGLHEYEFDKLVGVTQFFNMKVNPDLPESLWSDYFEGRVIADR